MKRFFFAAALLALTAITASGQEQSQRQVLPEGVTPTRYVLTVTPDAPNMTLAGDVRIDINVAQPTREIVVNALELTFDSVQLDNGAHPQVSFDRTAQTAHLTFPQPVAAGAHTLEIAYHGKIYRAAQGMFAYDYTSDHGPERVLTTQFEAADARRVLPCFDQPDMKAVFEVSVVVPQDRVVISNMPEAGTDQISARVKRVRFQPSPKMSSYLLFLGVGDFERLSTTVDGVQINIVAKRGSAAQGRFALDSAAELLRYYNDYFGVRYPLPKLDLVAMPGGGGFSAMENWGAILYFEDALLVDPAHSSEADRQNVFVVVAHEMAHQWFGDLVTMKWWDEIWLNEGFASWMERKATDHFHPDWNIWMRESRRQQEAMDLDARATTHPVVQQIDTVDQANDAFDRITYEKGRAVIRMIEDHVGADHFRDGIRAYMHDHAYGNATTTELWDAIEHASGTPMREIADDYTLKAGVPLITPTAGACLRGQRAVDIRQTRFAYDGSANTPTIWRTPVSARVIGPISSAGSETDAQGRASLPLPNCEPFIVNPDQLSYYRVRYPDDQFALIARNFGRLHAADQLGLLYDSKALGIAGLYPYSNVYDLASRTPRNADSLIWEWLATEFATTSQLYDGAPGEAAYRAYTSGVLAPKFARIGWEQRNGEPANNAIARETLIGALSVLGDANVEAEARRRFQTNTIPGSLLETTLDAVGRGADAPTFDALLAKAHATTDTIEKAYYYRALAHARDPALAQRALQAAFDPDVPSNLGVQMITVVALDHTRLAWDFAAAHGPELDQRLDSLSRVQFMPRLAAYSSDPDLARDLRSYIDTSVPAELRHNVEVYYLRLQDRIQVRQDKLPVLDTWIQQHGHS